MSNVSAEDRGPWWRGARGEWLVVGQIALIGLVFFGPRTVNGRAAHAFQFAVGWALFVQGWLTVAYVLAYVVVLLMFLDVKSRREERWLAATFPAYPAYPAYLAYQRRVRKLIPFLY